MKIIIFNGSPKGQDGNTHQMVDEFMRGAQSAGADNVVLKPAKTGSEDFSFYAQKVPGLFFFIGGMPVGKDPKTAGPHHTPEFKIEDSSFKTGVVALCNLVFDYPELAKK